jgi:glycosyltransferase involved in cell wall biosynthesis
MDALVVSEASAPGIIVIGRNEGERLERCFTSLSAHVRVVYVDSGSSDGSCAVAQAHGAVVIALSPDQRYTAARGRNAGLAWFASQTDPPDFVQMLDGDCELHQDWLAAAASALTLNPGLAAVSGRLRERYRDRNIYSRMCDDEWNVPVGPVSGVSGNAMFRLKPIEVAGGYTESLIAGEEIDLCLRIGRAGWRFAQIDAEMAWHDAAIFQFSQFWTRTKRAGYAFAEHVARNGRAADPAWVRSLLRMVFWGFAMPLAVGGLLLGAAFRPSATCLVLAFALLSLYGVQLVRMAQRMASQGADWRYALHFALLLSVGKFAQIGGATQYLANRVRRKGQQIIEY